jgi:spore germination protein KC
MRKSYVVLLMIISSILLTGCWDRYELEDRANILGLSIDLAEEHELREEPEVTHRIGLFPEEKRDQFYKVTAQVALPGKIKLGPEGGGGEGSEKTAWVIHTFGHTMKDAMANMQQQLAEKLYLGHLQIVVVSEDVAKKGLKEVNDFLRRDHEVRRTAWMVVNNKDASKVLKAAPPLETVPSLYLSDTLDNAVRFGKLPREYLGKFWIDLADDGIDAILPAVKVIENDRLLIDGLANFKGDKMVGRTVPIEIGAFMTMKEKNPGGYSIAVSLGENEGVYLVKTQERKSKILVKVENEKPSATIVIHIDAILEEEISANNIGGERLKKIEKEANEKMEDICNVLIDKVQEEGSDVLGLGSRVRSKFGSYWDEEVKTDEKWSEIFKEMDIKVTVNYTIRRTGMEWK